MKLLVFVFLVFSIIAGSGLFLSGCSGNVPPDKVTQPDKLKDDDPLQMVMKYNSASEGDWFRVYRVKIGNTHYLITKGYQCVSMIPEVVPEVTAEAPAK